MTTHADARRAPASLFRPRGDDYRRATRLVPERPLVCHLEPADLTATTVVVDVCNLSATGLAAVTPRAARAGDRFRLVLVNAAAMFCVSRTLTVARCDRHPCGWFVAGRFDEPLAPEELRPFLV